MTAQAYLVSAFPDGDAGGNLAGVVLDADGLAAARMQAIAARIGVSETAFVSRSGSATVKLDFFTPNRRIAHCGHATIASFGLLRALGRLGDGLYSKQTVDGNRDVRVTNGEIAMAQGAPRFEVLDGADRAAALAALGIDEGDLAEPAPQVVDTGNRYIHVAVRDQATLARIVTDQPAIHRISDDLDLIGFYVHTRDVAAGRDAAARMFAPRYGIAEEAATGTAATGLGALLHAHDANGRIDWLIEQGRPMAPPSPSLLRVRVEIVDGAAAKVWAGGGARVVREIGAAERLV